MVAICPCCRQSVPDNEFLVSVDAGEVSRAGKCVHLLPQEAKLLHELHAAHPGAAKHDDLVWALYGYSHEPADPSKVLSVTMSRLRRKIEPLGAKIRAVVGFGYRIEIS